MIILRTGSCPVNWCHDCFFRVPEGFHVSLLQTTVFEYIHVQGASLPPTILSPSLSSPSYQPSSLSKIVMPQRNSASVWIKLAVLDVELHDVFQYLFSPHFFFLCHCCSGWQIKLRFGFEESFVLRPFSTSSGGRLDSCNKSWKQTSLRVVHANSCLTAPTAETHASLFRARPATPGACHIRQHIKLFSPHRSCITPLPSPLCSLIFDPCTFHNSTDAFIGMFPAIFLRELQIQYLSQNTHHRNFRCHGTAILLRVIQFFLSTAFTTIPLIQCFRCFLVPSQ